MIDSVWSPDIPFDKKQDSQQVRVRAKSDQKKSTEKALMQVGVY